MWSSRGGATTAMTLLLAGLSVRPVPSFMTTIIFRRCFLTKTEEVFALALNRHLNSVFRGSIPPRTSYAEGGRDKLALATVAGSRLEGLHGGGLTVRFSEGSSGRQGSGGQSRSYSNNNDSGGGGDSRFSSDASKTPSGAGLAGESPRQSPEGIKRPTGIRRLGVSGGSSGGTTPWVAPARSSTGQMASYGAGQGGTTRGMHDDGKPERFGGTIPEDELDISFSRSSGAGGQNVNKLSTKVEIRFVVADANWLPNDVRIRLARQQAGRVNKEGELVVTSQEYRTQGQNRANAIRKLKTMIEEAWNPPKERRMRTGIGKAGKAMRRAEKEFRAKVKENRSKVRDFD